ncbi:MAG: hypothetical protein E7167_01520 [Firmicutes bacterium]|nr:hypothetical protein [Bacillota bacterium]
MNNNMLLQYLYNFEGCCNFRVLRNNKEMFVECFNKKDFLNNIHLSKHLVENYDLLRELSNLYKDNSLILYPDYNLDILTTQLLNLNISIKTEAIITKDIFEEKNITLKDCEQALEKYRKQYPNKLINILFIPTRIIQNILNNEKNIDLEKFQQKTMTFIVGF